MYGPQRGLAVLLLLPLLLLLLLLLLHTCLPVVLAFSLRVAYHWTSLPPAQRRVVVYWAFAVISALFTLEAAVCWVQSAAGSWTHFCIVFPVGL